MAVTYNVTMDDGDVVRTTVTSSAVDVISFLQLFRGRRSLIVGLDAEWRPNYQPGGRRNKVALLQLCVGRRCLIYQIIHDSSSVPDDLRGFLANPGHLFVGFGIKGDADKLFDDYGLEVANTADLGHVAARKFSDPWFRQAGMKAVAAEVLGLEMDKPQWVTLSAWDARDLTLEQIRYAAGDAYVSHEVGVRLLSGE
ncbi:hypothetical protein ACP70R_037067 [Stipagrostis hirtigluma subsp. patula]